MKNNKKTSTKVLEKIKQENISPRPVWHFYLIRGLLYFTFLLALVLGGLALALVFYLLISQDWAPVSGQDLWSRFFLFIPYAWLLALALLYYLIYLNIRLFPRAYKHSFLKLFLVIIFSSVLVAGFLTIIDLPRNLHENFSAKSSTYRRVFDSRMHPWQRPEDGFIAGKIIEKQEDLVIVKDFYGQNWQVYGSKAIELDINTSWRFIGQKTADNTFVVEQIRPWPRRNIKQR